MKKRGGSWFTSFFKSKETVSNVETKPNVQPNTLGVKPAENKSAENKPAEIKPVGNMTLGIKPIQGGSRRRKSRRKRRTRRH